MIPGAWINEAFNGLPPDASHDLYSSLYTWKEMQKAYRQAFTNFSSSTQCLCTLAKNFVNHLPKNPTDGGGPFAKLIKKKW